MSERARALAAESALADLRRRCEEGRLVMARLLVNAPHRDVVDAAVEFGGGPEAVNALLAATPEGEGGTKP